MSKKEIKLIVAILFVALGIYVGVQVYNRLNVKTYGIVTYKNQVIHTFNVNKDEDYYFNGSYGKMKLENGALQKKNVRIISVPRSAGSASRTISRSSVFRTK